MLQPTSKVNTPMILALVLASRKRYSPPKTLRTHSIASFTTMKLAIHREKSTTTQHYFANSLFLSSHFDFDPPSSSVDGHSASTQNGTYRSTSLGPAELGPLHSTGPDEDEIPQCIFLDEVSLPFCGVASFLTFPLWPCAV